MRITNLRPTPGVLIGVIALVFAFSGAAVAAQTIQTNDIAKKAVTGSRIAKDAVKSGRSSTARSRPRIWPPDVIPEVPQMAYGRVNKPAATSRRRPGPSGSPGSPRRPGRDLLRPGVRAEIGQRDRGHAAPTRPGRDGRAGDRAGGRLRRPVHGRGDDHEASTTGTPDDRDVFVQFVG